MIQGQGQGLIAQRFLCNKVLFLDSQVCPLICVFPYANTGFRKGRETRDQIASICWIIERARNSKENIYFCFIDYAKVFHCVDDKKLWKILKRDGDTRPPYLLPEKTCRWVKKQQLELDMEQWTGSKQKKEYIKAVYRHPAYLTYMQSTS